MPIYAKQRLRRVRRTTLRQGHIRLIAPPPTPDNSSLILRVGLTARNWALFRRQSLSRQCLRTVRWRLFDSLLPSRL